jgi:hypothetical protein
MSNAAHATRAEVFIGEVSEHKYMAVHKWRTQTQVLQ